MIGIDMTALGNHRPLAVFARRAERRSPTPKLKLQSRENGFGSVTRSLLSIRRKLWYVLLL